MSKTNMTRRTAIGLVCGAAGAAALATIAGLYGSADDAQRRRMAALMRDDRMPVAADVRSYMLEHADGVPHALAAAGTTAPHATDAGLPVRLVYTFVDANLVPEGMDFDQMWSDPEFGPRAHYATYSFIRTLTDVGNPDEYVLLATPWLFNDTDLDISYVAYTHDNDNGELVEGCRFDKATGLIYVPRSHYGIGSDHPEFQSLRIQMMLRIDPSRKLRSTIPVRVVCDDDRVDLPGELEAVCDGHSLDTTLPLCAPEQVKTLLEDEVTWWVSGMDMSQTVFDDTCSLDENGTMHIDFMGFSIPGIEIRVRRPDAPATPLGTRIALGLTGWHQLKPIWPWGYINYDPRLETMMQNGTIIKFTGNSNTVTAVDSYSWDHHPTIKSYIIDHFHELAPYTHNIPISSGAPGGPNISIKSSDIETLLHEMVRWYTYNWQITWFLDEVPNGPRYHEPSGKYYDPNDLSTWRRFGAIGSGAFSEQDIIDIWEHWLMLPGSDQIVAVQNDMGLGMGYWRTLKNVSFDNDTMIGTPAESDPSYNSCVLANAICVHTEMPSDGGAGPVKPDGTYVGPVYARILHIEKDAPAPDLPNIVIGFYTDGFGLNGKGQSAQAIIRFQLRPNTGFAEMQKGVTF